MKSGFGFKIAAMVILGIMILYWLYASLAAIIGGESRAVSTLVEMIVVGILAVLAWKWPLPGGIGLTLLAVAVGMYYLLVLYSLEQAWTPLLLICAPMAVSGLLLIEADWESRRARKPD